MNFRKWFTRGKSFNSGTYWESRYAGGRTSGCGSYGKLAEFKAKILNEFVSLHRIESVVEFGCGDGNQLRFANYTRYLGFDISETAVSICRELFKGDHSKRFEVISNYQGETADLALSLDVIYHLVEDEVYQGYMERLFNAARQFVIIYSNNHEDDRKNKEHVRFRRFTDWIENNAVGWKLEQIIENPYREASTADFYIYVNQAKTT